jgi:hypothetical protein
MKFEVLKIKPEETHEWLKKLHYAKRVPPISYAFGLYIDGILTGIVTYGMPSSSTLRNGICGEENSNYVLELNRLCFDSFVKNGASILVSKSLKHLPKPTIVISYADTNQGHVGYIYQACNFIYTGLSAKRTDWKIKGLEHLHGQTIADMSKSAAGGERGSRVDFMRQKFGDDFYLEERARKHRYIFIVGNKYQKNNLINKIKYKIENYPKGESKKYEINQTASKQNLLQF